MSDLGNLHYDNVDRLAPAARAACCGRAPEAVAGAARSPRSPDLTATTRAGCTLPHRFRLPASTV